MIGLRHDDVVFVAAVPTAFYGYLQQDGLMKVSRSHRVRAREIYKLEIGVVIRKYCCMRDTLLLLRRFLRGATCIPAFLVLLVLSGCGALFGPSEPDVRVTTDSNSYVAANVSADPEFPGYEIVLDVRMHNRGSRDAVLATCGNSDTQVIVGVELLSGPEPRLSAFDPIYGCPASAGLELEAGETRRARVVLRGPNVMSGGAPIGSLEGMMRLVYFVESTGSDRRVRSNSFSVSLQSTSSAGR